MIMKVIILYFILFGISYFILKIREKVRNLYLKNSIEIPPSIWLSVICPPLGIIYGIVDLILWKLNI